LFLAAIAELREGGLAGINAKARYFFNQTISYRWWISRNDVLTDKDCQRIVLRIGAMSYRPVFSVLMPVHNPSVAHLRLAIASVAAQIYPNWQLCIADDASDDPCIAQTIDSFCQEDSRIKFIRRLRRGHISVASNSCLELAQGEFVALLDHDDMLAPQALYMAALALNHRSDLSMIYSDEDKINDNGTRTWPHFKPDWNPDLMRSQNAVNHLCVYRTALVRAIGGFRLGVEGCQDWDLALRVSEKIKSSGILHLPYVLYHWRITTQSTALGTGPKEYVSEAGRRVLIDHIQRMGEQADVVPIYGSYFRVRYRLDAPPSVAVISQIGTLSAMKRLVKSLTKDTDYPDLTLVLLTSANRRHNLSEIALIAESSRLKLVLLGCEDDSSLCEQINHAVLSTTQPAICFFDPECVPSANGWLIELVSHAMRPTIGAAGPKLLNPNGTVHSAGTVLGLGRNRIARPTYAGTPKSNRGPAGRAGLIQNYSAISARCMVFRREVFMEAKGFDGELPMVDFGDVDFCLRVGELGYRVIWTPFAELVWSGSTSESQGSTNAIGFLRARWRQKLCADPAHNPNLSLDMSLPILASVPRVPHCSAYRPESTLRGPCE
jgi:glycosyltransferase involved in cell wall biosynthesis